MSKRSNMNTRRRQIRRALNRHPESLTQMGLGKINRMGYGCGLDAKDIKERRSNEDD